MPLETNPAVHYSDSANSRTYARNGHTNREPLLAIYKRTLPKVTADDNGVADFTVKLVKGDVDAAGAPRKRNTLVTLNVSMPQDNDATDVDNLLTYLGAILADGTLMSQLKNGILPSATEM